MKTKDRNELIQRMLEFAHIKQDELTEIEYSEGQCCLDVFIKPGQIEIRLWNDGYCVWSNEYTNQNFRSKVDFSYKP